MPPQIHEMTPLLPERAEELQDLALEVIQKSAALGARQHPITLRSLREFLRIINSYYSNLIEGHNTHPYRRIGLKRKNGQRPPRTAPSRRTARFRYTQREREARISGARSRMVLPGPLFDAERISSG